MLSAITSVLMLATQLVATAVSLESQLISLPQGDQEALLLRIKNVGPVPSLVCVRAFSYRLGSGGAGQAMPHGCLTSESFVLVLPGESYFHKVADVHDVDSEATLSVHATVIVESPSSRDVSRQERLEWNGNPQKARDGFRALAGGR